MLIQILLRCKSVTEVKPEDCGEGKLYPAWVYQDLEEEIGNVDIFTNFHEQYVADIEFAHKVNANPEMIKKCEEQLLILEDLLVEKKSMLEETNIKTKKGKKKN